MRTPKKRFIKDILKSYPRNVSELKRNIKDLPESSKILGKQFKKNVRYGLRAGAGGATHGLLGKKKKKIVKKAGGFVRLPRRVKTERK